MSDSLEAMAGKARIWAGILRILIGTTALLFVVWMDLPPPQLKGFPLYVFGVYFVSLIAIFVVSFAWLRRYGDIRFEEPKLRYAKPLMVASLVLSIVVAAASALFVLFALAVGGLINMI
jgi:hypothetical protein